MNEDKASRYHRLKRQASLAALGVELLLLSGLLVTGWARALWDAAASLGGWLTSTLVFYALLAGISEALQLPIAFYQQVILERRYGLLTQSTPGWLADRAKGAAIAFALGGAAAVVLRALLALSPAWWWIWASLLACLLMVALAGLLPIVILPLFYTIEPLRRDALAARLVALAGRARTPVVGVFEWRLADRTRKANAVLTGLGRTRRILLSDTLLSEHGDDEIEVILAHELAHCAYRDIWSGLALEGIVLTAGLYLADLALAALGPSVGVAQKDDPVGLLLLALCVGAVSLAARPLLNALSRYHERRADRFALDLTRAPGAFVTAMKRLAAQNLAEEQPPRLVELLLHTHPTMGKRIAAARDWELRHSMHKAQG